MQMTIIKISTIWWHLCQL